MEANFKQTTTDKEERYSLFLPQFELLISNEKEEVSVLANACAALHEAFGFFWVGFYLVKMINSFSVLFKEVSLVTISAKEKEYAELHGLNLVH